jgi:hypothetical protein
MTLEITAAGAKKSRPRLPAGIGLDRRTKEARRLAEIVSELEAALPAPVDPLSARKIIRLAELLLIGETIRHKAIAGRKADLDRLVKIENSAARLSRELGLDEPRKPAAPKIDDYLKARGPSAGGAP